MRPPLDIPPEDTPLPEPDEEEELERRLHELKKNPKTYLFEDRTYYLDNDGQMFNDQGHPVTDGRRRQVLRQD